MGDYSSDTTEPILENVPDNLTVNTIEEVPVAATPTALDNCDNDVNIEFSEETVDNGCGAVVTRTWTAIDNCGNTTKPFS